MDRRKFIKTSAGFLATPIALNAYSINSCFSQSKKYSFKRYRKGETLSPVFKVTPDNGFFIHSFYDVCPFSPSQKYLAVTKLPFQNRDAEFGDLAEVCIIDLHNEEIKYRKNPKDELKSGKQILMDNTSYQFHLELWKTYSEKMNSTN